MLSTNTPPLQFSWFSCFFHAPQQYPTLGFWGAFHCKSMLFFWCGEWICSENPSNSKGGVLPQSMDFYGKPLKIQGWGIGTEYGKRKDATRIYGQAARKPLQTQKRKNTKIQKHKNIKIQGWDIGPEHGFVRKTFKNPRVEYCFGASISNESP